MSPQYPIVIISGPSGAGEDSIIEGLMKRLPLERVITTTTRVPRFNEYEGHPYHFISDEAFEKILHADGFVEHAQQYNNKQYGVSFEELERVRQSGKIGIWKLDYKGVQHAKTLIPAIKAVLIDAPLDQLEARIRRRDHVDDAFVAERMVYTKEWLNHTDLYDFEVVNEDGKLLESIDKTEDIIRHIAGLDKKSKI